MKKLLLSLMVTISFLIAAEHYLLMQSLLDRQTTLAVAINAYIEDRGSIPASIATLKSANYLPLMYDEKNPYDKDALTFTIANKEIRIDSNVETNKRRTDDVLFYGNSNQNRELDRRSVQEGGKLISYYTLSAKAATNLNLSSLLSYSYFVGDTNPTTYATVNDGALWFSSTYTNDMYKLYYFSSGWKSLERGNKNFNSISGGFENQRALQITKTNWKFTTVDVNTVQKSITCFISGTTYNPYKDRCEAYTANACDSLIFRTATGYCDLGDNSGCTYNGGTWDTDKKLCKKGSSYNATTTYEYVNVSFISSVNYRFKGSTYATTYKNNNSFTTYLIFVGDNDEHGMTYVSAALSVTPGTTISLPMSRKTMHYYVSYNIIELINNPSDMQINLTDDGDGGSAVYITNLTNFDIIPNFEENWFWTTYSGIIGAKGTRSYTLNSPFKPSSYYRSISAVPTYTCDAGGTLNGTTCDSTEYFAPDCSIYGTGYAHDGFGRCAKAPTCTAKTMPVSPYYATPYYGNNGVCYSDVGLYCKTYGVSFDGLYTCFNYQFGCEDSSYNLRTDTDVCEKFNLTCSTAKGKRYGLAESPTNNNVTDLYDRIIDKDTKANTYVSTIVNNDVTINDNAGAMCTALEYSTFTQGIFANDYTIGGEVKSGF